MESILYGIGIGRFSSGNTLEFQINGVSYNFEHFSRINPRFNPRWFKIQEYILTVEFYV